MDVRRPPDPASRHSSGADLISGEHNAPPLVRDRPSLDLSADRGLTSTRIEAPPPPKDMPRPQSLTEKVGRFALESVLPYGAAGFVGITTALPLIAVNPILGLLLLGGLLGGGYIASKGAQWAGDRFWGPRMTQEPAPAETVKASEAPKVGAASEDEHDLPPLEPFPNSLLGGGSPLSAAEAHQSYVSELRGSLLQEALLDPGNLNRIVEDVADNALLTRSDQIAILETIAETLGENAPGLAQLISKLKEENDPFAGENNSRLTMRDEAIDDLYSAAGNGEAKLKFAIGDILRPEQNVWTNSQKTEILDAAAQRVRADGFNDEAGLLSSAAAKLRGV